MAFASDTVRAQARKKKKLEFLRTYHGREVSGVKTIHEGQDPGVALLLVRLRATQPDYLYMYTSARLVYARSLPSQ